MRGRVIAYVCDGGDVKWVRHEGYSKIEAMLLNRPDCCKYVVTKTDGEYWCVDMYELNKSDHGLSVGRYTVHPTEEAAIMAALLTYQTE